MGAGGKGVRASPDDMAPAGFAADPATVAAAESGACATADGAEAASPAFDEAAVGAASTGLGHVGVAGADASGEPALEFVEGVAASSTWAAAFAVAPVATADGLRLSGAAWGELQPPIPVPERDEIWLDDVAELDTGAATGGWGTAIGGAIAAASCAWMADDSPGSAAELLGLEGLAEPEPLSVVDGAAAVSSAVAVGSVGEPAWTKTGDGVSEAEGSSAVAGAFSAGLRSGAAARAVGVGEADVAAAGVKDAGVAARADSPAMAKAGVMGVEACGPRDNGDVDGESVAAAPWACAPSGRTGWAAPTGGSAVGAT